MSSASSYSYNVRAEALRREQERRAAEDALRAAELRYAQLIVEANDARATWGEAVDVPGELAASPATGAAEMTAARTEVERRTADASRQLADQVSGIRIGLMKNALADLGSSQGAVTSKSASEVVELHPEAAGSGAAPQGDDEEIIDRLLRRIDIEADPGVLEGLEAATLRVHRAGSSSSRDRAIDMLRLAIQEANADIEERRAFGGRLTDLERRLDGCRGPEAEAARALLANARDAGETIGELAVKVDLALAAEEANAPVRFVSETIERVFRESGYEIGPRPATAEASDGLLVTHTDWPGYGVEIELDEDSHLEFELVRGESARTDQAARDKEVEKQFCSRQDHLLRALSAAGVEIDEIRRLELGESEIVVRPDLSTKDEVATSQRARSR